MGRKFIDKKNSQKFHLLHRSQTDTAHAREGVPSEFVLVAASKVDFLAPSGDLNGNDPHFRFEGAADHVNALGLPNDGYDYDKHLREMGILLL
jgi:protein LTV1